MEAAEYIDKIIAGCNDMKIYGNAIELACIIFPAIGRYDDALRLVADLPDTSKDEMLTALYSGDKLIEHTKISFASQSVQWQTRPSGLHH